MTALLNDLHDFTTTQLAGSLSVRREHVNLRAVCEEAVKAQLAHSDLIIELARRKNIAADIDPLRIRQLLANLIGNAVSYGAPDRPVRVSVNRVTGACVITVSNEGKPIPEDVIPSLFEPFRRGPGTDAKKQQGHMGLGLYIVQQIAHAHDGSIDVDGTPEGTHFSVYIPIQQ